MIVWKHSLSTCKSSYQQLNRPDEKATFAMISRRELLKGFLKASSATVAEVHRGIFDEISSRSHVCTIVPRGGVVPDGSERFIVVKSPARAT